jgi:hypothetical protein
LIIMLATTFAVDAWVVAVVLVAGLVAIGALLFRLRKAEHSIVALETQVSPFWASLQTKIVDALHQPDVKHAATDELLEKLQDLRITSAERRTLETRLKNIKHTATSDVAEKAEALLMVMPLVLQEAAGDFPVTDERPIAAKKGKS